jgi:putative MATE family efflux protein
MNTEKERELFESCSVSKAIFTLAFPTVVGQIILVIYNMADTFYVGLTGNDAMLTAVTVCMPAFMFLSAIANLFGVGGASVISRAMGAKDCKKVKNASSYAFYGCIVVTLVYSALAFLFKDFFVDILGGTNPEAHRNAVEYLMVTVILGGLVTSLNVFMAHLIRSEGRSVHASVGIAIGGLMNIALDPLFMFLILPAGKEAMGAAIATTLSNVISLIYFVAVLIVIRKRSSLYFGFSSKMLDDNVPREIFNAGIPACVMTLFENISYAILDNLMSVWGITYQAGIGVAKKVNMLAHCIVRGIAQGSLPLIGYNFAAGNIKRMRKAFFYSSFIAVIVAGACMIISLIFARPLIGIFIHSGTDSIRFGSIFLRILCIGGPFSAGAYTIITFFQATGEGRKSFILALLRKGIIDLPLLFILNIFIPVYGIVMATPIADAICCVAANIMFAAFIRKLMKPATKEEITA